MSAKSVETSIRDLVNTVLGLQSKIVALEKIVLDQNDLIKKLISASEDCGTSVTKNIVETVEGRLTSQTSQRPMRDAHIRALSALATAARKAKGVRNQSPARKHPETTDGNNVAATAEAARTSTSHSAPPTPTKLSTSAQEFVCAASMTHAQQVNKNSDNEWIEVKSRRSRRTSPSNVIRGTAIPGSSTCFLSAAERKSYLHLYYLQIGTTVEQVMGHLATICPGDDCSAESLKSRGDYASFKLTVPTKHVNKYLSPEYWAKDVCIKPWHSGFRKSQQTEQKK